MSTLAQGTIRSAAPVVIGLALIASACSSSTESSTESSTQAATTTEAAATAAPTSTTTEVVVATTTGTQVDDAADVASLYEAAGNPDADTVLVFAQGGPAPGLDSNGFGLLTDGLDLDAVYAFNVHQAQTIDPEAFTTSDIDFDVAQAANAESVRILGDVVRHFESSGRRVVVLGISYGAFLVQDLLATQGNVADEYVIVVGRLDFPDDAWMVFSEGGAVEFVDGTDFVEVPIETFGYGTGTREGERNMSRLLAGVSSKRYTELLAGLDLSNVTYAYADADEQVGRLTPSEITFLEVRGAEVLSSPGGHVDAIFALTGPALAAALG